jgi:histidine kinase
VTTGIAHELAQPLTGIKGIAQNMIDDINYDELDKLQAVAELQRISSLVDKSSTIIDHIRNFSKKSGFSMRIIDLNNSILEAIDLIHHQLKKNNIDLLCDLHENIQGVYGDTISIEQLIVNLVLNAKDAIIEKKHLDTDHEGLIKITTSVNNHKVRLIIKDNGIGIPKDIIPKIWSPFFTSKKRNHGTGIGLSICSKIIKEHNAEVTLDTSSGGTTFTIDFPIPEETQ